MTGDEKNLIKCNCGDYKAHVDPNKHHPRCAYVLHCKEKQEEAIERARLAKLEQKEGR